ncbi:hypothetical protein ERJ75_001372800 [Trypanosoma vivax]|nr:hypothetical protein ERJ75_001372800 [Trypanosoma vivax]
MQSIAFKSASTKKHTCLGKDNSAIDYRKWVAADKGNWGTIELKYANGEKGIPWLKALLDAVKELEAARRAKADETQALRLVQAMVSFADATTSIASHLDAQSAEERQSAQQSRTGAPQTVHAASKGKNTQGTGQATKNSDSENGRNAQGLGPVTATSPVSAQRNRKQCAAASACMVWANAKQGIRH